MNSLTPCNKRGRNPLGAYARAIDTIFHKGKIAETYNIGGFNEWKNIDIIKVLINTVDRLLGRPEGTDMDLPMSPTVPVTIFVMPLIAANSCMNLVGSQAFSLKKALRRL